MANTYRNIWKADATTNIVTVYTCPAETVAVVKSVSPFIIPMLHQPRIGHSR